MNKSSILFNGFSNIFDLFVKISVLTYNQNWRLKIQRVHSNVAFRINKYGTIFIMERYIIWTITGNALNFLKFIDRSNHFFGNQLL